MEEERVVVIALRPSSGGAPRPTQARSVVLVARPAVVVVIPVDVVVVIPVDVIVVRIIVDVRAVIGVLI